MRFYSLQGVELNLNVEAISFLRSSLLPLSRERFPVWVSQEGGTWEEAVSFVTSSFSTLQDEEHLVVNGVSISFPSALRQAPHLAKTETKNPRELCKRGG